MISSGSDGLLKLWNIKSNECVATFDNHEDKVWALTVKQDGQYIVSGSADSKITFWEDISEKEREEMHQETEMRILK